MSGKVGFLYAVSQLHAGKGSDVGVVDLPIQRERHTELPVISGIKGAIRNEIYFDNEKEIFGNSYKDKDKELAGNLAFSEAKILFFPIRSIERGFVWATSPLLLNRLKVAFDIVGTEAAESLNKLLKKIDNKKSYSSFQSNTVGLEEYEVEGVEYLDNLRAFLEDFKFIAPSDFLQDRFADNVLVLSDDDFKFFVKNSTEVVARIQINDETGTTDNLWYEEYLPQDTIMYFILKELRKMESIEKFYNKLNKSFFNIGGDASIGKGFSYITLK